MKKSDKLKLESQQEENDLKALGIGKKVLREERNERFEDKYLEQIKSKYEVYGDANSGKYTIDDTEFGVIDFFPKANKILIRKENKWMTGGLKWIKENLL